MRGDIPRTISYRRAIAFDNVSERSHEPRAAAVAHHGVFMYAFFAHKYSSTQLAQFRRSGSGRASQVTCLMCGAQWRPRKPWWA